jgi:hypothetical protein
MTVGHIMTDVQTKNMDLSFASPMSFSCWAVILISDFLAGFSHMEHVLADSSYVPQALRTRNKNGRTLFT